MKINFTRLKDEIKAKAVNLCYFHSVNITDNSPVKGDALLHWLKLDCHGQMKYMATHPDRRLNPTYLLPETQSVILTTLSYSFLEIKQEDKPKIASYALGRDYHKIMRSRLKKLLRIMFEMVGSFQYRMFVDSAPILEKSFAQRAGLGWVGKNTLLIQKGCGSFFVIGGICCDLPLPPDQVTELNDCGDCDRCIQRCPTGALIKPYHLNASRCVSYLTMEHKGSIPIALRSKMGRYIFGCDECQIACPWNQRSGVCSVKDFQPRQWWLTHDLIALLNWTEAEFLTYTEGSSIRRIGYERFLRNVAIAIGNSSPSKARLQALEKRQCFSSQLVQEHINWAIDQLRSRL
jgi:epoxyqueuosine reductase